MREGGRERGREGGSEGRREGGREGGREGASSRQSIFLTLLLRGAVPNRAVPRARARALSIVNETLLSPLSLARALLSLSRER